MSRDGIIEGMARAIWVSSYADWVGSMTKEQRRAVDAPVNLDGVDWYEETPDAPEAVAGAARELVSLYESENDTTIEDIEKRAAKAQKRAVDDEELGRYLAEMAMNTGVSWFDDHAKFDLKTPLLEAYYDGEFFEWSGRCKTTMTNPSKPSASGPLQNVFLKREKNGWHVEAEYPKQILNYGPFATKEHGMRMRESVIESDLQRNPCGNPPDNELELYISNDGELYEKYTRPIQVKLADAMAGGSYSRSTAVREFMALAEIGAKKYQKEITPRRFTDDEKRDYANSAAEYFENEWALGNFSDYAAEATRTSNPALTKATMIELITAKVDSGMRDWRQIFDAVSREQNVVPGSSTARELWGLSELQTQYLLGRKNPAALTKKGERMYEHIKAGYGRDPRAKEIAARTVAARAKEVPGLRRNCGDQFRPGDIVQLPDGERAAVERVVGDDVYVIEWEKKGARGPWIYPASQLKKINPTNPPSVLPIPGQAIRSWDHGDGRVEKICEEGYDGRYTVYIKLDDGHSVSVPLTRTEYDLSPRKYLERRTGFSRHEQYVAPTRPSKPERAAKGTPMEYEDTIRVFKRNPKGHK